RPVTQPHRQRLVRQGCPQIHQQVGTAHVAYSPSLDTGGLSHGLNQMTFPNSTLPNDYYVVVPPDELSRRQFFHAHAIDCLGIELPVERRQGLGLPESRLAYPVRDASLTSLGRLLGDQRVQERQVRLPLALGSRQRLVESVFAQRHFQRREVCQDAL